MLIPGYKVIKFQPDDEFGRITVLNVKEGESDTEVFSIDSDGIMIFSIDALKQARTEIDFTEL